MKLGLKARRLVITESGHHRLVDGYHRLLHSRSSQTLMAWDIFILRVAPPGAQNSVQSILS